jgi:RND family efflux transporter MFP subunit
LRSNTFATALLPLLALWACSSEPPPADVVRPVLSITVADVAAFSESTLPGRAKAAQEADLAFEVPGRLIERPVSVGDRVTRGQLVARLDPRDFEARLLAARGAYRTAKAEYERAEALVAAEALAENVRDQRRAAMEVTAGEFRLAEKALADTRLEAPFDGVITGTYLENFQNVRAKQRIVRLLDDSTIEMEVSVPESLISLAPVAYDVQVEFDNYPGRKIPARITEIGDEASAATRTYPVTVAFTPPAGIDVKPGMAGHVTARADLPEDARERGIEIPLSALFSPPDDAEKRSYVWVVDESGPLVSRREVAVQRLTPRGARVAGIQPGERVVTVGVHHLREGQRVALLD